MHDIAAETEWRPTPKFVLRNACVREVTASWEPGRFLETGAGTGTMTRAFLDRGFTGICFDITPETRVILRENLTGYGDRVHVADGLDDVAETFDYLLSFEVLEHIEDDLAALRQWTAHLRPGGRLIASVPAHQRKYDRVDASVGHVRRYERAQLEELLRSAGYEHIAIFNYGFPLGNVTRFTQHVSDAVRRRGSDDDRSYVERSVDSGVKSSKGVVRIAPLVNRRTLAPFVAIQRRFFGRELGDGFVVTANRPGRSEG
jgi:SAM-dependent methyltransferase